MPKLPLSAASLFELYKMEKEALGDDLTSFPSFSEWKVAYVTDRATEMDDVSESVKAILKAESVSVEMSFQEDTPNKPSQPTIVKKKKLTNMDKARTIFQQMFDEFNEMPIRKDVMAAFMKQLKVSTACASTYHHNIKQKYN